MPAVLARAVGVRYPSGRVGLDSLDLVIGPGEAVAVLGPNGSGKTSLLRALATDLLPTEGELSLLGHSVLRDRLARTRRLIGYAADTAIHFDVLTGSENARIFSGLAPAPHRPDGGPRAGQEDAEGRIRELFTAFDLQTVSDVPVAEYSFGMKRKLLLIQTLALDPPLLLLDEPAVGLDPRAMSALREALDRRRESGGTVVLSSNEVREVPLWAERILFFHGGRLVADAPLLSLLGRLEGRTRIEIDYRTASAAPRQEGLESIDGVEEARLDSGGAVLQSSRGGQPLPAVAQWLQEAGCRIRDVRVREPDLSDVFRELTGEVLGEAEGGTTEVGAR